jgi:HAD superfamily hydrolase (TIGR01509 family)
VRVRRLAVGFDFDHTLGVDHKLERSAFVDFMRSMATDEAQFNALAAAEIVDDRIAHYRAGKCTLAQAFEGAFEAVQGKPPPARGFAAFKQLVLELAPKHVEPLPGAQELLRRLDSVAIPYAILTNGWNPLQQCKADLIGFGGPVLVSDDLGVRKPSVQAFDALRQRLGEPADAIWYVGDDAHNDILGALGAGMRAIWFDWEHKKYPTNVPAPTAVVTQLVDIFDILI